MAEKVVIGNAELWHGDCREVLPLLPRVDATITDPLERLYYERDGRHDPDEALDALIEKLENATGE